MIREKLIFKIFVEAPICPIEALDFISAHETATGVSMDQIQKDAICGFVSRLQGNDTTNGSDLWAALVSHGSYIWPLTPSSDSVASADGYRVELISQSQIGTYNNFITSDITPNGVNPNNSNTKYFDTGIIPNTLTHETGIGVYQRTDISSSQYNGTRDSSNRWFAQRVKTSSTSRLVAINSTANNQAAAAAGTTDGLQIAHREDSSTTHYSVNGVVTNTFSRAATGKSNLSVYFHNRHIATGTDGPLGVNEYAMYLLNLPWFTTNELADFYEAVQWYQTNVITGGRQV